MADASAPKGPTLSFDVATAAIKGSRNYQEDSLIANFPVGQKAGFTILADGMGGHYSGNVASALVMSEAFAHLKMKEMLIEEDLLEIPKALRKMAEAANARIARHMKADAETNGMGSTLLAVVVKGAELFWLSIGDSPLYLFRDGELRQLNQDHSMAPQIDMMVAAGALDPDLGRDHPDRNVLLSAVVGRDLAKIDCPESAFALQPDDILITASDGLQYLSDAQITEILTEHQQKPAIVVTEALLDGLDALADAEQDNVAFSLVKLKDVSQKVAGASKAAEAEDTRTSYWYRGQKYYKD